MNHLSRFPGTTLREDRLEQQIEDAEDAFECAIGEIQACIESVRKQQDGAIDPHGCFDSALNGLSDSIADLQFGKSKAAEEAAEQARNG